MKKILITGVAGMLGSHLLDELLKRDYKVIGIDNLKIGKEENIRHNLKDKNFTFKKSDILDIETLNKAAKDIDIIVHLAAAKKIDEKGSALNTLRVNSEGTYNIFEIAKKKKIKVIFASTSDVYGLSNTLPLKEDGNLIVGSSTAKRWSYAVSKIYGEQVSFAYYKEHKVPMVILRYFGSFSPRSSFTWSGGHIPVFIDAILNNKEVIIHGDGTQTRSMGYAEDSVNGTILAMENERAVGEIFNIGNNEEMSIIDTVNLIQEISGKQEVRKRFVPFEEIFGSYREIMRRVPDLTKSNQILGYFPRISLREAIEITIKARMKEI